MTIIRENGGNYLTGMVYEYQSPAEVTGGVSVRYISDTTTISRRKPDARPGNPMLQRSANMAMHRTSRRLSIPRVQGTW
jgi:hypothetical protein